MKITVDLPPPVVAWLERLSREAVAYAQSQGIDAPKVQTIEQVAGRQLALACIADEQRARPPLSRMTAKQRARLAQSRVRLRALEARLAVEIERVNAEAATRAREGR